MILSLPPIKNGMFEKDVVAKDLKRRGSHDDPIRPLARAKPFERLYCDRNQAPGQQLINISF